MIPRFWAGACAAATALALAPAANAETVTVGDAVERTCQARPLSAGTPGIAHARYTAGSLGAVTARLTGSSGDWDLALFDARSRRLLNAGATASRSERADVIVPAGTEIVAQACRRSGRTATARLAFDLYEMELPTGPRFAPTLVRAEFGARTHAAAARGDRPRRDPQRGRRRRGCRPLLRSRAHEAPGRGLHVRDDRRRPAHRRPRHCPRRPRLRAPDPRLGAAERAHGLPDPRRLRHRPEGDRRPAPVDRPPDRDRQVARGAADRGRRAGGERGRPRRPAGASRCSAHTTRASGRRRRCRWSSRSTWPTATGRTRG